MIAVGVRLFLCFWIAGVVAHAFMNLRSGLYGLRSGNARMSWMKFDANRNREPVEFWLAIAGKFATSFVLAPLLILFALDIPLP